METLFTIFITTVLLCTARAEIELIVTPEIVQPDITPFFTLRCSVLAVEEANVASITLSRRAATVRNVQTASKQLVAELRGATPLTPTIAPGFEKVQVQGQISQIESELGTYLEVVWPQPGIDDLGLYTCEVTILQVTGGLTMFAEVRVSTSSAVTDYLLHVVHSLGQEIDTFNKTLQEIGTEIDDIKAESPQKQEITSVKQTEEDVLTSTEATPGDEPSDPRLDRLTSAIERLELQFELINDTLVRLDAKVSGLGENKSPPEQETTNEEPAAEEILTPTEATPEDKISTLEEQEYINSTQEEVAEPKADPQLGRLSSAIERLEIQFELFNKTLVRLDKLIADLGEDTQDIGNKTSIEQAVGDVLNNYFVAGNATYFLFYAAQNTDSFRAQEVCESKRLFLAEIKDEEEFQAIINETSPYVPDGGFILVGGQRKSPEVGWTYQGSQELVNFFAWGATEQEEIKNNACLALRKGPEGLSMVSISCFGYQGNLHFLCQRY